MLKKEHPKSFERCVIICGDVLEPDLGIIDHDRKILKEKVHFIIHSAASTRFDDTIEYACRMNTLGTKYMLDLAKECQNLKVLSHRTHNSSYETGLKLIVLCT